MTDWLRRAWHQMTGKRPAGESSASSAPSSPTTRDQWTVRGVYFDTRGWRLTQSSPTSMTWTGDLCGVMTLTSEPVSPSAPPQPINLDTERRQYRARAAAADGGLVSVEPVAMPDGRVAIEAITKRPKGLGFGFDATLSVVEGDEFSVRICADEQFTGRREAVVHAQMWQLGEITIEDLHRNSQDRITGGRKIPGMVADPYDPAFDDDAVCGACDDPRLDALLPDHPLTVIRATLRQVRTSWTSDAGPTAAASDRAPMPASAGPRVMLSVPVFREIYWAHGRGDVLEPELQAAIAATDSGAAGDPEVARLLMMLGLVQQGSNGALKARVALQRAVEILTIARGADHRETGIALALLGRTQMHLDRKLDAERSFRRAVAILEKSGDADALLLLHSLSQLGTLLLDRGNVEEGTATALRAHELLTKAPKADGVRLLRELVGGPPAAGIAKTTIIQARG